MIYEIVCNETDERYIGSTFQPTLAKRMTTHRSEKSSCISKQIIGRGNYTYGLLEKVDVSCRDELRMKEREWYNKLPNINNRRPYISEEEATQRRREYSIKYGKTYSPTNKLTEEQQLIYAKVCEEYYIKKELKKKV